MEDSTRLSALTSATVARADGATLPSAPADAKTVALLYKRHAPDSPHLLGLLERELREAGYRVFIDRHLAAGVEWARELKRQVSEAYAVVPLLSPESIWSEMVEEEIRTAHEARQERGAFPRILPVRVRYGGPLPDPLNDMLGSLQYVEWSGPADDLALVEELLRGLEEATSTPEPVALEPVGGAVPPDSPFYVVRPTDTQFHHALERRDSLVLVKGARQMGKTSLLTRGIRKAKELGFRCLRTDFQKLTSGDLATEDRFFSALAEMLADQLDLDDPQDSWNARRSGASNFERFMRRQVLTESSPHCLWALDEVDKLFACPFGTDVFALFRSWHNDRAYEPEGPWGRLTMGIAYATEAHLFITDINQSPFNVGTRLTLADFTVDEVAELNRRYGSPLPDTSSVARFHKMVGGQPYLTRRGLDHLAQNPGSLREIESLADRDEGLFGDHLRRLLVMLSQDAHTLEAVTGILRGSGRLSAAAFYQLRSGGLLSGSSEHDFRMRCELYDRYLRRHLPH